MINQLNRLDQVSNNLANVNTNGFKQEGTTETTFNYYLQKMQNEGKEPSKVNVVTNNVPKIDSKFIKIEAKKDVNKINNALNNVSSTVTTDVPKIDVPEVAVEAVSVDLPEKVEIEVKQTPVEDITTVVKDNKEDTKEVVSNTTNTLLDKLVIEAKKDVNKINNALNNVSSTVTTDVPKIDVPEVAVEAVSVDLPEKVVTINSNDNKIEDNPVLTNENKLFENIETVDIKVNEELSLMDKLIQKTTEKIITTDTNAITIETTTTNVIPKDLITNIYLGSQKNQLNNQSLFNKNEAISLLKEGNSVQAIKTSADMLELGLQNIDVQQIKDDKLEIKKTVMDVVDRKNMIDSILSQKNVKSEEVKNLITQSVEASKALLKDEIHFAEDSVVNVSSPLSYNIQSKIIGAKQQMVTVMSDIARQMYENYKPPVTAFRINLNPTELGSIAILMKSDKNSGLSISLNASNSITLDTLVENQNVLKNSLSKTFNENTKFNLDFNSSHENNSNQSSNNQDNQQNNRRFEQQIDTQSILKLQEENKDIEEKILDYM